MESIVRTAYFSRDPSKFSTHYHDSHEIIFIVKGEAEVCVNEAKFVAKSGSIVLFSRYENHSLKILSKDYERFVLRVNPFFDRLQSRSFSLLSNRPEGFNNIFATGENFDLFLNVFSLLTKETSEKPADFEEMQILLVNQILLLLCRQIPTEMQFFREENFKIVSHLQRQFETSYKERYNLKDLANQFNISPSSLSHKFKSITGSSVMDYLLSCRIAAAKNLLAKTDLSVGEIVEQCGFSDDSNFSRTFKKLNGISPSKFREKYKKTE